MNNQVEGVKVKILTLGESGVGKSSLLQRYKGDKFEGNLNTTLGVEYKQKQITLDEVPLLVQVWDTAGQERFKTITPIYYRSVDGALLVFDISEQDSFDKIEYWIKDLQKEADLTKVVLALIGNKADLEDKRKVDFNVAQEKAKQYNIEYFETSAKKNSNVEQVFESLVRKVIEKKGGIEKYRQQYVEQVSSQKILTKEKTLPSEGAGKGKGSSCC